MFDEFYEIVKRIPAGKVATYGQIAAKAGFPKCARQVGWALHVNPRPGEIPCHRVVNRHGALAPAFAFGGKEVQKSLLEREGVNVNENYSVDLNKYLWICK